MYSVIFTTRSEVKVFQPKTFMRSKFHKSAFTLVELLVTITIIATLASLTFFISSRARQGALSAKTINNLREIGVASGLWSSDNNSCYTISWEPSTGNSYAQYLDPYMHGVEKYRSTDSKFIGPDKRLPVKVNKNSHPITYSANKAVWRDRGDGPPLPMAKVTNPSEVIMLADGGQDPGNLNQANATNYKLIMSIGVTGALAQASQAIPVGPDADTSAGQGWFRYPWGKCHALFCDGSARTFKKGTILKRNIWFDTTTPP